MRTRKALLTLAATLSLMSSPATNIHDGDIPSSPPPLHCIAPPYLHAGDTIALISPSYVTPMENVYKTVRVLRQWGLVPVIGPHVGNTYSLKYAGTVDERLSDLRWALNDPSIKAIICNRGGYGTLHFIDKLSAAELSATPKWIVGYSDITTLHGMETCSGVMSIHGSMSSQIASSQDTDATITLLRDMLTGKLPRYELPNHPQNLPGHARGVLIGGNICTFAPMLDTWTDATSHDGFILFIEEVEESMHNIDRLFNMLLLRGAMSRCRGVILGQFTDCGKEFDYDSVEAMLRDYLKDYDIPVACGMPSGHGKPNYPLMMGALVDLNVQEDGATITFCVEGKQQTVKVADAVSKP